ncbi:MAG: LysM domain-containing protein [Methylacidiphilaceae bacterium]|nr:LysM domain-containing protein [Candidatus Methylacidiphilaceae bacterium]
MPLFSPAKPTLPPQTTTSRPAAPPPPKPGLHDHQVQPGETLSAIAASHQESLTQVEGDNPQLASNYNLIRPGEWVFVRGPMAQGDVNPSNPSSPQTTSGSPSTTGSAQDAPNGAVAAQRLLSTTNSYFYNPLLHKTDPGYSPETAKAQDFAATLYHYEQKGDSQAIGQFLQTLGPSQAAKFFTEAGNLQGPQVTSGGTVFAKDPKSLSAVLAKALQAPGITLGDPTKQGTLAYNLVQQGSSSESNAVSVGGIFNQLGTSPQAESVKNQFLNEIVTNGKALGNPSTDTAFYDRTGYAKAALDVINGDPSLLSEYQGNLTPQEQAILKRSPGLRGEFAQGQAAMRQAYQELQRNAGFNPLQPPAAFQAGQKAAQTLLKNLHNLPYPSYAYAFRQPLQAHGNDPQWLAGFFQGLGPSQTADLINRQAQWPSLSTYPQANSTEAQALGAALPYLPPSFGAQLASAAASDPNRSLAFANLLSSMDQGQAQPMESTFVRDLFQNGKALGGSSGAGPGYALSAAWVLAANPVLADQLLGGGKPAISQDQWNGFVTNYLQTPHYINSTWSSQPQLHGTIYGAGATGALLRLFGEDPGLSQAYARQALLGMVAKPGSSFESVLWHNQNGLASQYAKAVANYAGGPDGILNVLTNPSNLQQNVPILETLFKDTVFNPKLSGSKPDPNVQALLSSVGQYAADLRKDIFYHAITGVDASNSGQQELPSMNSSAYHLEALASAFANGSSASYQQQALSIEQQKQMWANAVGVIATFLPLGSIGQDVAGALGRSLPGVLGSNTARGELNHLGLAGGQSLGDLIAGWVVRGSPQGNQQQMFALMKHLMFGFGGEYQALQTKLSRFNQQMGYDGSPSRYDLNPDGSPALYYTPITPTEQRQFLQAVTASGGTQGQRDAAANDPIFAQVYYNTWLGLDPSLKPLPTS